MLLQCDSLNLINIAWGEYCRVITILTSDKICFQIYFA